MQFDGKRVVSGAYDYLVRVWDPVEGNCLHVLQGHTNRVYSLQVRYCMLVLQLEPFLLLYSHQSPKVFPYGSSPVEKCSVLCQQFYINRDLHGQIKVSAHIFTPFNVGRVLYG